MKDNNIVRVRAAPSPTGRVHTGNLRTFLNNYLWARHNGGVNVLRVEDTDVKRSVEGGVEAIIEVLELYGITFDEGPVQGGEFGPYLQSQRLDLYRRHAEELVDKDCAYYCFCSEQRLEDLRNNQRAASTKAMYDRKCREISIEEARSRITGGEKYVVRMKFPTMGHMEFVDEITGRIRVNNKEIDDMVLLKADGFPTYHFAVVVDDHHMAITHVFRGREYLTQTTRDMFLYESFGWSAPKWVHTPHLLNPDGKGKLSKRYGAQAAIAYLRQGYLPEAVLNYLVLAGWAPRDEEAHRDEVYSLEELIRLFDIKRMKKSNARFDQNKMDHLNGEHIRRISTEVLVDKVLHWAKEYVLGEFVADKYDEHPQWEDELKAKVQRYLPMWEADRMLFTKMLALEQARLKYLSELPDLLSFFFDDELVYAPDEFKTINQSEMDKVLLDCWDRLKVVVEDAWEHTSWEKTVRDCADSYGWKHGDLFMLLRIVITGRKMSPPLFECMEILGTQKCDERIRGAVKFLSGQNV